MKISRGHILVMFIVFVLVSLLLSTSRIHSGPFSFRPKASTGREIQVCASNESCLFKGGVGLQLALNSAQDGDTINIGAGIYSNPTSAGNIRLTSWRECSNYIKQMNTYLVSAAEVENEKDHSLLDATQEYPTSFIVKNKNNILIRGKSPANTILVGTQVFGFTVEESKNITLENITFVTNGGFWRNGTGDSAVNIHNSTGTIQNSIITSNKNLTTNPNYQKLKSGDKSLIDQEGIQLIGVNTNFNIYHNFITDNFHTGIMMEDGAKAHIVGNLITDNGKLSPLEHQRNGHGIALFYDDAVASICSERGVPYFSGKFSARIWNNIITDNGGVGVMARGNFDDKVVISHNTFFNNKKGVKVGAPGGKTVFNPGSQLLITSNFIVQNQNAGIEINGLQVINKGINLDVSYNNSVGNLANNYAFINMTPAHRLNQETNNLQIKAMRDDYFRLLPSSPVIGKGYKNTDISSYSIGQNELNWAKFKIETYTLMRDVYYPQAMKALNDIRSL